MKVTSADVAARAGVSRATVSYVLNDTASQTISAATREAVHAAARELGYRPNAAARALRTGHNPVVLLPLPGLRLSFAMDEFLVLLARRLGAAGLTLVTDLTPMPTSEEQLNAWLRLQPAVVVDLGPADRAVVERVRDAGVAVLTPTVTGGDMPLDVVGERLRREQLTHVMERGCTRPMMICPALASSSQASDRAMFGRLHRVVADRGGTLTVHRAELDLAGLSDALDVWQASRPRPDVICAYNDVYAVALLTGLRARGMSVPDDVGLIGSDNTDLAAATTPPLTSVTAGYEEFADRVVDAVRGRLAGGDPTLSTADVPVRVVRRGSVA